MTLQYLADRQVFRLTNSARTVGLPREIEIWFVVCRSRVYLFAETGEAPDGQEYQAPSRGHGPVVRPAKAGAFSGRQSRQGKSQKPCSLDAREAGNQ